MITCTELSERMPAVALGRSAWSDAERAHLAECAGCREEWAVVQAGSRLGGNLPAGDVEAIGAGVLLRLHAADARDRARRKVRTWTVAGLAVAAAVALAVWTGRDGGPRALPGDSSGVAPRVASAPLADTGRRPAPAETTAVATGSATAAPTELPLPELDGLDAAALDSVLRVLDQPLAEHGAGDPASFDDDADRALERALDGQEG